MTTGGKTGEKMDEKKGEKKCRIGVYVCQCGGNISDVVDVPRVVRASEGLEDVVVSRHETFMCSDPGQNRILEDIAEHGLDRVVVAACSPSLHELTFRSTLERAGLNPFLYEHANIREQVSWSHKSDHVGATEKAARLVRVAVAKARLLVPLEPIKVPARQAVAVIGGGLAGLRVSLELASGGFEVHLIEQSGSLGGNAARWGCVYPTEEQASVLMGAMVAQVASQPSIHVYLQTEVVATAGYLGNFDLRLQDVEGAQTEVGAGAIVVATGFENYQPQQGELGWGNSDRVITLPQLLERLDPEGPTRGQIVVDGAPVRSMAFIHCVGSRQLDGIHEPGEDGVLNEHCSRICCTTTLRVIRELRQRFPEINVLDLFQDIRSYGRGQEEIYEEASSSGVIFFRYEGEEPPTVEVEADGSLVVRVVDALTYREELELPVDLVVLVTGLVPRKIDALVKMLKLPRSPDGFLQEVHPKLRPVEVSVDGVFVAGTCQAPMDMGETSAAAGAAAAKAAGLLAAGTIALPPFVATIDPERCDCCGLCVQECAWVGAITQPEGSTIPEVNAAICKGCGMCVAICPQRAIEVRGWQVDQFDAMVDALVSKEAIDA